uniref:Uncharacterized protein n=1 Tax=Candidatus Kentrum sp. MB TaxID=2138164 RepID=A0A450X148_9GAMM|nr:MAG: hypothetical protein BECKMB1821G_GA0114241_100376 [Candidatus Kentron sp. MB]VFK26602.1 MAG: hypothetical protein BECKMB1821I_GA0114274_100162 [Candidatus Kentron sp. MB]VFK74525.1 MAG: hypothetical protein BECKMB1821H_GA0114242_100612 [Candidatus Kentron sp. MB]
MIVILNLFAGNHDRGLLAGNDERLSRKTLNKKRLKNSFILRRTVISGVSSPPRRKDPSLGDDNPGIRFLATLEMTMCVLLSRMFCHSKYVGIPNVLSSRSKARDLVRLVLSCTFMQLPFVRFRGLRRW